MEQILVDDYTTTIDPKTRVLLLAVRQALLIVLGALENHLGIPRSVEPRRRC